MKKKTSGYEVPSECAAELSKTLFNQLVKNNLSLRRHIRTESQPVRSSGHRVFYE